MECGSAKRTRLAAIEAAKEAHVYPVTLEPGQVTVTEQLIFAEECAKEVVAAERALMMTAQETALVKIRAEENADMIAADQTTLAAANRRRAEETADKIAADQTTLAAANRRWAEENADKIAADQTTLVAANRRWAEENADKIAADQTKINCVTILRIVGKDIKGATKIILVDQDVPKDDVRKGFDMKICTNALYGAPQGLGQALLSESMFEDDLTVGMSGNLSVLVKTLALHDGDSQPFEEKITFLAANAISFPRLQNPLKKDHGLHVGRSR
jgi:hypothetical protein